MTVFIMSASLAVLVACSAFFSASETAFLSLSKIRLRQMLKEKQPKAKLIARLKNQTDTLLTTILIGNNFVNSLSSSLATALAILLIGEKGVGIATLIMTGVIIIFGEVLPKTVAGFRSEHIASKTAVSLAFLEKLLFPIVWVFTKFTSLIHWLSNKIWKSNNPQITEDELKTLFDVGGQEGTLETGEKDMLHKIFEFSDLRVRDIQRARPLVRALPVNTDYAKTLAAFSDSGYSRLPVYTDSFDNIEGLVHFKDLLFYTGNKKNFGPKNLMHPVLFVPETQAAVNLLHLFKNERQNFAVVVNEHGSNSGIVTVDDILKAVFGRITDEYNTKTKPAEERITIIGPAEFIIPGDVLISDINSIFGLKLESDEYDTFGGWLLEQFGYLPDNAETLRRGKLLFLVENQSQRRIQRIRMQYAKDKPKDQ